MLIPLSQKWNIRDLGGITNRNGVKVIPKRFIRAGCLDSLTDADWEILTGDYNVRKVIDMRTAKEASERADFIAPGVAYLHIPVFDEEAMGISREKSMMESVMSNAPDLVSMYANMVCGGGAEGLRLVLKEIMSTPPDEAVLFHCTAGKDRTGIISMLILYMLDVPEETILSDYLYTNDILGWEADMIYEKTLAKTGIQELALALKHAFSAREEFIRSAIDAIEDFGGMDEYIREAMGVSDEERQMFREQNLIL